MALKGHGSLSPAPAAPSRNAAHGSVAGVDRDVLRNAKYAVQVVIMLGVARSPSHAGFRVLASCDPWCSTQGSFAMFNAVLQDSSRQSCIHSRDCALHVHRRISVVTALDGLALRQNKKAAAAFETIVDRF